MYIHIRRPLNTWLFKTSWAKYIFPKETGKFNSYYKYAF